MKNILAGINKNEKIVIAGLSLLFIINLINSMNMELTFDEAYYWVYSQNLAWGYFDHPPFISWVIKLGTSIFGISNLGVRIVPNILFVVGCMVMWKMTNKNNPLVFLTLVISFLLLHFIGLFALPDIGLYFFSILYFYILKKFLENNSLKNAILLGITISLLFYSKYHGLLIVLLTLMAIPKIIVNKKFWVVFAVGLIAYTPHLYWQYQHEWISFKFHLFGRKEKHFDIINILEFMAGQLLLAGFLVFISIIIKLKNINFKSPFERVMVFNSFGFLFILLLLSMRNPIEANWTTSVAVSLVILFCDQLDFKVIRYLALPSVILVLSARVLLFFPDYFKKIIKLDDNRLYEVSGWNSDIIPKINRHCDGLSMFTDNYHHAAKLSFDSKKLIPALHLQSRPSQFSLINKTKAYNQNTKICYISTKKKTESAYYIYTGLPDNIYVHTSLSIRDLNRIIK